MIACAGVDGINENAAVPLFPVSGFARRTRT
jgi:hypothetical protein